MKYISGQFALNLPCSLDTCGDWHTSGMDWGKLVFKDSSSSIFGEYGLEECSQVPEHKGTYVIANTLRALLDLLDDGLYGIAQGAKEDYICNDFYTQEFFKMVSMLKNKSNWSKIDEFMGNEYMVEWLKYKRKVGLNAGLENTSWKGFEGLCRNIK